MIAKIDLAEAEEAGASKPANEPPKVESNGAAKVETDGRSFVEKAEEYIRAHPEGVRTRDVAKAIGQDVSNVDGTLRILLKRGDIVRDQQNRKWYPASAPLQKAETKPEPEKMTIRELIYAVFAVEKAPLGAAALYKGIQKMKPDINRSSVDGEINRMKKDKLLVAVGTAPHGGSLYNLTNGGGHAVSTAN